MRYAGSLLLIASFAFAGDAKIELGRRLFMDPTASRSGRFSCSSCHLPEHGFSDPRALSEDENGKTSRHSQPLLDLDGSAFHWDGEFGSVRDLLTARLAAPDAALGVARDSRKHRFEEAEADGRAPDRTAFNRALRNLVPPYYDTDARTPVRMSIELRLAHDGRYENLFRAAFGKKEPTTRDVIEVLDAYVTSLRSGENAYDRYVGGDRDALTRSQINGLALFTGKAGCVSCHWIYGERPPLTDGLFHNTGVTFRNVELELGGVVKGDGGFGEISFVRADLGKFKTPSLRDVSRRPPYMHDGSFQTLEEVVRYYDRGGTQNRHLDPQMRLLRLEEDEVKDIVAFLTALESDKRPGIGPAPAVKRRARIRVLDLGGRPMISSLVTVRPAGDRLGDRNPSDQALVTDSRGYVSFDFPASTHVRLLSPQHEIHYGWLIPDCVTQMDVVAAPLDTVALRLRGFDLPERFTARDAKHGVLFTRVRKIDAKTAIYVAAKGAVDGVFVANLGELSSGPRELDLSGGWTDPIDLIR